jgi:hypothetical protein
LFNYVAAAATVTSSITFDNTNAGDYDSYVVAVVPNITIASGIGVTVTGIVTATSFSGEWCWSTGLNIPATSDWRDVHSSK